MASTARLWATVALAALLWSLVVLGDPSIPSIPMNYCASINTGSTSANHSIYQSDGLCHDFCKDQTYKLAVLQGDSCWCSNNVPDTKSQVSVGDCNASCPGFPSDICGGPGLYGYIIVEATAGSQPILSPSPTQNTVQSPEAASAPPKPTTPTVKTVTADGSVMTVTVMPTAVTTNVVGNSPNQAAINSQNNGLGAGAAAGIAIGAIAGIVAAGVVAFCVWRRRKQRRAAADFSSLSPRGSSAGMTSMGGSKAAEAGVTPPFLRNGDGYWEGDGLGRRRSMLMPIDPRIDPTHTGFYNRNDNKSHDSVNTLRDDQDYSRKVHQPAKVLRVTNPGQEDD